MGKQKKTGRNYKVFGLGWDDAKIEVSIVPTELYIPTFLLPFFFFHRELDRESRTGGLVVA